VFACELAVGMSQADAYRKAYPKSLNWKDEVVWAAASKLANNSKVRIRVKELQEKACKENEITVEKVLKRYWDIATANPNELTQYRRENCRYCYGHNHQYQWIDEAEFFEAEERRNQEIDDAEETNRHKRGRSKHIKVPPPIENLGGYGFERLLSPHAKCPKCNGEGETRVFFHDTRQLSGSAKLLYAGVEISKEGLKIKMHDQKAALDKVAAWLGMDKKTLAGDKDNPLVPTPPAITRVVIVPAKEKAVIETKPITHQDQGGD
jgi:phage terminase small subunit